MSKCAILYKSKYGTTKQYAEWIAEMTGGDLFELPGVSVAALAPYETVIIGGGLYAGGILGFSFFKRHFNSLKGKKIIIFSVGASFNTEANKTAIIKSNLTGEMLNNVKYFHLRGGLNYPGMKPVDRFAMCCLKKIQERKPEAERDIETAGIIETYGKKVSFLDKNSLAPLLEAVRQ